MMGISTNELDIAVIGYSGRFPGAVSTADYWDNLINGRESVRFFSDVELRAEGVSETLLADPHYVKAASVLDDVDLFDAEFFGYSAKEAARIDPQSRLFLECAWEALESAGYAPSDCLVAVGLYASQSMNTYLLQNLHAHLQQDRFILSSSNLQYVLTNINDFLTTRVSYKLNLKGPSVNVQCACSSSLVAVHMACQSLIGGECQVALAGGASIYLPQRRGYLYEEGMILSPDGHCRAFDADANGTIFGRGVGVVVLKMLEDAVRDGDAVYAVIKGSAVNNDGANKIGFTAPSVEGQAQVIAEALENAGVSAETISYIEAHGTGTTQGDPIEVAALTQVYRTYSAAKEYCAIGTVKANFGHLDAAAGIAGFIKTVLMLHHRKIPPQVHFRRANPLIDFSQSPFYVSRELKQWEVGEPPRRAGVSAFGMGGTNAHVILEEAPALPAVVNRNERPRHILTLSAKSPESLQALISRYIGRTKDTNAMQVADICYTANSGRVHLDHRLAVVVETVDDLRRKLVDFNTSNRQEGELPPDIYRGLRNRKEKQSVVFLFTGQGAQYPQMGRQLYETHPVFREELERCDTLLRPHLGKSLTSIMFSDRENALLEQTFFTQPALFALEYSLSRLWMSWGVKPDAVIGHSVGEFVAACIAGVFSLQDGLRLVAERARLMGTLPEGGGMAAVLADERQTAHYISEFSETVSIAAVNSPANTVISGNRNDLDRIIARLQADGINVRRLAVSHAFHSPLVEPVLEKLQAVAGQIDISDPNPQIRFISNVTGKAAGHEITQPTYWGNHARQPVRFAAGMRTLERLGYGSFLETGPHPVLIGMGMQCVESDAVWLPSLRKGRADWQVLLSSLGTLYTRGHAIDWSGFDRPYHRRRVMLPTYPFERSRHWIAPSADPGRHSPPRRSQDGLISGHPLIGDRLPTPQPIFESSFEIRTTSWFQDHRVFDRVVVPGTAFLEMALAGLREAGGVNAPVIEAVNIDKALALDPEHACRVQLVLTRDESGAYRFQVYSGEHDQTNAHSGWTLNVQGLVHCDGRAGDEAVPVPIETIKRRCTESVSVAAHYRSLKDRGLEMGPSFQGLAELWRGDQEACGRLEAPAHIEGEKPHYIVHPCLLDACLQVVLASLQPEDGSPDGEAVYVPVHIESLRVFAAIDGKGSWSHARLQSMEGDRRERVRADIRIADDAGNVQVDIRGLHLRRVSKATIFPDTPPEYAHWLYRIDWEPIPTDAESAADRSVDFLPAPAELAEEVTPGFRALADTHRLEVYRAMAPEFDRLCAMYIWAAFQKLGLVIEPGRRIAPQPLVAELGILPKFEQLVARYLEILGEDGFLEPSAGLWQIVRPPDSLNPDNLLAALENRYTECRFEFDYIALTGPHLAEILIGATDPLQLLFPEGDLSTSIRLYQDSGFAKVFNETVRKTVETVMARLPAQRKLRILEAGAGTGGTTAFVLPHLDPAKVEYCFTDVTPLFLQKASGRFRDYAFLRYEILDLEKDPGTQGFENGAFDLIIGANVVHATRDLQASLSNLLALLAPGGLLVLLEVTGAQRFADITVGTLEGWWRFDDYALRPSYPLLSESRWRTLLTEVGFAEAASVPDRCDSRGDLSQQAVILATAPGPVLASAAGKAQDQTGRRWLVFGDPDAGSVQLERALALQGDICELVISAGAPGGAGEDRCHRIDADSPGEYKLLLKKLLADQKRRYAGIVHLWGCDNENAGPLEPANLEPRLRQGCGTLLYIVQALIESGQTQLPRLWVVTRGALAVGPKAPPTAVEQAPLWGMAKVVSMEHPELACTCVDLDPQAPPEAVYSVLQQELVQAAPEEQIAIRGRQRYGARLLHADLPDARPAELADSDIRAALQIVQASPGILDSLTVRPAGRRRPEAGEVEIQVSYSGLNFLDVLTALNVAPVDRSALGHECSGTITAVGRRVTGLRPGDKVVAIAPDSFRSYLTTTADRVYPIPAGLDLSLEAAATLPVAFLTAFFALQHLGGMTAGQSVLIHAAAGGVGLAAVRLAQQAGAMVLATAGSPEKRAFLKSLGVEQVMDSRTLAFAEQIMQITHDRGVDIVLNSLAGDFIPASIGVLQPKGCFLEIGKTKIYTAEQFAQLKPEASYFTPDLMTALVADPSLGETMMGSLWPLFTSGRLKPLPVKVFAVEKAGSAFQYMARAKHIGKIVLSHRIDGHDDIGAEAAMFDPHAGYLITGGLGGLGLLTADWMVENGARHIALMGRSQPNPAAREALKALERRGVQVLVLSTDVADFQSLTDAFAAFGRSMPRLKGVVHAAGVLDDGVLLQQQWPRFMKVFGPKIFGAWNLHVLTRQMDLDFFIVFSSIASVLGSAGQANHAAANAFMDALMHYRKAEKLPALSINWGAWGRIGAAVERDVIERWSARGITAIEPSQGMQVFDRLFRLARNPDAGEHGQVMVLPIDWQKYLQQYGSHRPPSFFARLWDDSARPPEHARTPAHSVDLVSQLAGSDPDKQNELVVDFVRSQVVQCLELDSPAAIGSDQVLSELGLDSLLAVELRTRLSTGLGLANTLPATLVFDYPTIEAITAYLFKTVLAVDAASADKNRVAENDAYDQQLDELEQLSEEEAEALLLKELSMSRDGERNE